MKCPPLPPLIALVRVLEDAGLPCALGGSGLLVSLGLSVTARDWDVTTDAPLERVREALARLAPTLVGSSGGHLDHKLVVGGGQIECIVRFTIRSGIGAVHLPTVVTGRWQKVPTGSPEVWATAYSLLGRDHKAALLLDHLGRRGADPAVLARLLDQPLPGRLADVLRGLPPRTTSSTT